MKCTIPEIAWHNRDPVLSIDFQYSNNRIQRLATGGTDSHVLIWHVSRTDTGSVNLDFVCDISRHNQPVNIVRFSPNGEILASGDTEATIWLWKQSEKETPDLFGNETEGENKEYWLALRTLRGHLGDVCDLSWSLDSTHLVSGSVDGSTILWDAVAGKKKHIISDNSGFVQGVAWDPLNQYVATLSNDRSCRIYNLASANKRIIYNVQKVQTTSDPTKHCRMFLDETFKSFFRRLTFSPRGEILIAPSGIMELEDGKTLKLSYIFSRNSLNKPVMYLPTKDQCTVAVRCCPVLFELRNNSGAKDKEPQTPSFNLPYRIVFAIATQNSILLYDTQQPIPFGYVTNIHYAYLTDLSWSADGRILVASSCDGYCSFITFNEGEIGKPYVEPPSPVPKEANKINTPNVAPPPKTQPMEIVIEQENAQLDSETLKASRDTKNEAKLTNTDVPMEVEDSLHLVLELTSDSTQHARQDATTKTSMHTPDKDIQKSHPTTCNKEITKNTIETKEVVNMPSPSSAANKIAKAPRRVQFITLSSPKNKPAPKK